MSFVKEFVKEQLVTDMTTRANRAATTNPQSRKIAPSVTPATRKILRTRLREIIAAVDELIASLSRTRPQLAFVDHKVVVVVRC